MSIETFLLLVIIVFIAGALPLWPYNKPWGYRPMGLLTLGLVIYLVWAIAAGRPLFKHSVGQDLRQTGRDVADSVRRSVQ